MRYAIFGAGKIGEKALNYLSGKNVVCFIDNNARKQGTRFHSIEVMSIDGFLEKYKDTRVMIALRQIRQVADQLRSNGILDFDVFPFRRDFYYPCDQLVFNPYLSMPEAKSEEEWNQLHEETFAREYIYEYAAQLYRDHALFDHVEIETYNRCNGGCDFCPVSVKNETRPEKTMSKELFCKIIDDLCSIDYSGRIALFSNNEPFLDERIIDFHKIAKDKLPKARFHLYTNGTKLNMDVFLQIIDYLDELIIDNYNQNLELNPNSKRVVEYCKTHEDLVKKVTVVLRKPKEILTTRGGDAPNRKIKNSYDMDRCLMPYKQLVVRPDGKVSLCCNDPLGRCTLGDLSIDSIMSVWNGASFDKIRKVLMEGRGQYEHCKYCDAFILD